MKGGRHHRTCAATGAALQREIEAAVERVSARLEGRPILPWLGESYGGRGTLSAKRVLVLGHSNYEWCRLCHRRGRSAKSLAQLTCYSVAARMLGDEAAYNHHWPSIELALKGGDASEDDRRQLWRSIAYANYIPRLIGWESRAPANFAMWREAKAAFPSLLEALRPSVVLVLGETTWCRLPEDDAPAASIKRDGREILRCVYRLRDGSNVLACRLRHPRAGLGGPWHPVVTEAIAVS